MMSDIAPWSYMLPFYAFAVWRSDYARRRQVCMVQPQLTCEVCVADARHRAIRATATALADLLVEAAHDYVA